MYGVSRDNSHSLLGSVLFSVFIYLHGSCQTPIACNLNDLDGVQSCYLAAIVPFLFGFRFPF